ncbi:MAG TPA: acetyltransferase, partial [Phenylobacterium sp.]
MHVTLETAAGKRQTVENLFQLYVHDFADFWVTRQIELGEDGRFPPYPPLAAYWSEPDAEPWL